MERHTYKKSLGYSTILPKYYDFVCFPWSEDVN